MTQSYNHLSDRNSGEFMMSGSAFKVREVTVQPIRSQADYVQTVSTI